MPQFDFSTFAGQIFWLFVSFALLYVLVARIILPKLVSIVDAREKKIADDIASAKDLHNEIDYLQAQITQTKRNALREVTELHDAERKSIDAAINAELLALRAEIHAQHQQFIEQQHVHQSEMRQMFLTEVESVIETALKKILGETITKPKLRKITQEVAKELSAELNIPALT